VCNESHRYLLAQAHQGRGKEMVGSESSASCHSEQSEESRTADYQKFALEYFDFLAALNKPGMKMVTEKWQKAGLKLNVIFGIKKIINKTLRGEIKRIESKKPLPTEKQEKMANRIMIERIEAATRRVQRPKGAWQSLLLVFPIHRRFSDSLLPCCRWGFQTQTVATGKSLLQTDNGHEARLFKFHYFLCLLCSFSF
jgi:hypothetical protein